MNKIGKGDFAFNFSGKCLIDTLEYVFHSEMMIVIINFYLHSAFIRNAHLKFSVSNTAQYKDK